MQRPPSPRQRTPPSPHVSSILVHTESAPFMAACSILFHTKRPKIRSKFDQTSTHSWLAGAEVRSHTHTELPLKYPRGSDNRYHLQRGEVRATIHTDRAQLDLRGGPSRQRCPIRFTHRCAPFREPRSKSTRRWPKYGPHESAEIGRFWIELPYGLGGVLF